MSENVAVAGMTLVFDPSTVSGTILITGVASVKAKATNGIYQDGLSITVSAITVPTAGATIPDPGPYTSNISSSSLKVKAKLGLIPVESFELVLLEGDESDTIDATPQIPSSPDPIDYPISFKIKISAAGQDKVKAN